MLLSLINICNYVALITPRSLEQPEGRKLVMEMNNRHQLTHYMICESDRLRIDEQSICKENGKISFSVLQQTTEYHWERHEITTPTMLDGLEFDLIVEGPKVILKNERGQIEWFDNTFIFLGWFAAAWGEVHSINSLLELTVKYIGQTEISDDYIRFDGHEKLNSVSNDVIALRPHREVWVKMLAFPSPYFRAMVIPGIESPYRTDWLPGGGLVENVPYKEWKTIVEGALIKYFNPEWNKHYKNSFPSESHTSYRFFYDRDIRSVIVELHEEFNAYVTGSESVPYTKIRVIEFALSLDGNTPFLHDNSQQDLDDLLIP